MTGSENRSGRPAEDVPPITQESLSEGDENDETQPSDVVVAPWVILVTFFLGWGLGGGVIAFTVLTKANNVGAFLIGGWLMCLPLIATRPFEVLRKLLGR